MGFITAHQHEGRNLYMCGKAAVQAENWEKV